MVRIKKSKTFFKFLLIGTLSYFVNAISLGLLYRGSIYSNVILPTPILSFIPSMESSPQILFLHIDRLLIASLISIELSIIINFLFHDNWTFKGRSKDGSVFSRFFKFNLTSIGSPFIQLVSIIVAVRFLNLHEQIGLAFGVIVGLFVNYFANLIWIWKEKPVNEVSLAKN